LNYHERATRAEPVNSVGTPRGAMVECDKCCGRQFARPLDIELE
jgi:hypothetical protein